MVKVGWPVALALAAGSIARADAPTSDDVAVAFQTFEGFDRVLAPQVAITGLAFHGDCGARFGHPRSVASADDRRGFYECLRREGAIVVRASGGANGVGGGDPGFELRLEETRLVAALELDAHGKIDRIAPPGATADEAAWPTFEMHGRIFEPPPDVAATLDEEHGTYAVLRFCVAADGKIVSHRVVRPTTDSAYARAAVAYLLALPPKPAADPKAPTMCMRVAFGYPMPPPPSVLPTPGAPHLVPPTVLESHRISGEREIHPDAATFAQIKADKRTKLVGSFKLCVDDTGAITKVLMIKSTGYPTYDAELSDGISTWRYSPYEVNGAAVPVCTAVTFIFAP